MDYIKNLRHSKYERLPLKPSVPDGKFYNSKRIEEVIKKLQNRGGSNKQKIVL